MTIKKEIENAAAAAVQTETVTAPAKNEAAEAPAKKPAAAKAAAKPAAKKPAAKKAAAKKAAAKPAAPKETVKIQFGEAEYDLAEIRKAVAADCKRKFKGTVKDIAIYVKPEDKAAYYVINSDFSDKIDLA